MDFSSVLMSAEEGGVINSNSGSDYFTVFLFVALEDRTAKIVVKKSLNPTALVPVAASALNLDASEVSAIVFHGRELPLGGEEGDESDSTTLVSFGIEKDSTLFVMRATRPVRITGSRCYSGFYVPLASERQTSVGTGAPLYVLLSKDGEARDIILEYHQTRREEGMWLVKKRKDKGTTVGFLRCKGVPKHTRPESLLLQGKWEEIIDGKWTRNNSKIRIQAESEDEAIQTQKKRKAAVAKAREDAPRFLIVDGAPETHKAINGRYTKEPYGGDDDETPVMWCKSRQDDDVMLILSKRHDKYIFLPRSKRDEETHGFFFSKNENIDASGAPELPHQGAHRTWFVNQGGIFVPCDLSVTDEAN